MDIEEQQQLAAQQAACIQRTFKLAVRLAQLEYDDADPVALLAYVKK